MDEAVVKAVSLFFLYTFLDDKKCLEASISTLSALKGVKTDQSTNAKIVKATYKAWRKLRGHFQKRNFDLEEIRSSSFFKFKEDLAPWRDFHKLASEDELLCLVWAGILNFSEKDIAEGLGVSTGTVRFRLSRAYPKLGGQVQNPGIRALRT